MPRPTRAALIGAGYIAGWHADALRAVPGARLTAVCDLSPGAAQGLADATGARAFTSLEQMVAADVCDAVHILTPPPSHAEIALRCLNAGLHVLVEKPVALSGDEAARIEAAARANGRVLAVSHNFLGLPGYRRLKQAVESGALGRIDAAEIHWCLPLAPLRSGPYGLWLVRSTRNLLLELGPHLVAFASDLFGTTRITRLETARPVALPGAGTRPQVMRMSGQAANVMLDFTLSLVETHDERSVTVRGSSGMARLDYANDVLVIRRDNAADLVLNPALRELSLAAQHLREGSVNAARQLVSLNALSPYGLSFRNTVRAFHAAVRSGAPVDPRFSGASAVAVMRTLDQAAALLPAELPAPPARRTGRTPRPDVLVIGGTGFIGRHLTRALVARGHDVRVASRGRSGPFDDLGDRVETVPVDLSSSAALATAMDGIEVVFDLAKSLDTTWQETLANGVAVTERIGRAALGARVRRLIHTGTIASYDMSDPARTITEATGFAEDMSDRNLYARGKAEGERRLMRLHREHGLALTVARPGIVIGPGGPLQHWGIGRWHGAGAVRLWGDGRNLLPFVLIDDLTEALLAIMDTEEAAGQSFNLVGPPLLSGRGYFDAIHTACGARIRAVPGNLTAFWLAGAVKHTLKTRVLKREGLVRPSLRDWKSRAHLSPFDNALPRRVLGWRPEADPARFVERGIARAGLFGF